MEQIVGFGGINASLVFRCPQDNNAMRCFYCNQNVIGTDVITVPEKGPAHQRCFQIDQSLKRTFQHLKISELNDQELVDLNDLVLAEINDRERLRDESSDSSDIELF